MRPHLTPPKVKEIMAQSSQDQLAPPKDELSTAIVTGPNILSCGRLVLVPVIIWCLINQQYGWAMALTIIAMLTDFADGKMARAGLFGGITKLGKILDPVADKALTGGVVITTNVIVTWVIPIGDASQLWMLWVSTAVFVSREVAVFLMKVDMTREYGVESSLESGRGSMTIQCVCLVLLPTAIPHPWLVVALNFGIMCSSIPSGWDYIQKWRTMLKVRKLRQKA